MRFNFTYCTHTFKYFATKVHCSLHIFAKQCFPSTKQTITFRSKTSLFSCADKGREKKRES